jgi:spore coat protein SA
LINRDSFHEYIKQNYAKKGAIPLKQLPRVAIITPGSHPIPDPLSTSVETVVDKMTTHLQDDIECIIFGKKTKKHPSYDKRGKLTFIRYPFKNGVYYITRVINKLEELQPDIIQVENRPKYIEKLREAFPSKRIWLFLHSTVFIERSKITRRKLRKCLDQTDKVIVNSQFLKDFVVNYSNCDEAKVIVHHLGIDTNQFQSRWAPDKMVEIEQLKQALGVQNKNIVLYVGRLLKKKGVHHLLNVFPNLLKHYPNTMLMIVGSAYFGSSRETKYVKQLYKLAENMPNSIRFVPYVPHNEIQKWFQIANIIVVPSAAEPFGLVNIEAMATGVTVVATNSGGIPEIIEHGKTGILINPKKIEIELTKTLIDLLSSAERTSALGKAGIRHVHKNFTWEHSANRMLELYNTHLLN